MRYIIIVTTLDNQVYYHNRNRYTLNDPYEFTSINNALRVARKTYGPKLGYSIRSWAVSEIK